MLKCVTFCSVGVFLSAGCFKSFICVQSAKESVVEKAEGGYLKAMRKEKKAALPSSLTSTSLLSSWGQFARGWAGLLSEADADSWPSHPPRFSPTANLDLVDVTSQAVTFLTWKCSIYISHVTFWAPLSLSDSDLWIVPLFSCWCNLLLECLCWPNNGKIMVPFLW